VSEENMAGEEGAKIDLILWTLFIVGLSYHWSQCVGNLLEDHIGFLILTFLN